MVFFLKLWFNCGMFKDEAIDLLGGSAVRAAELMGVTYQAVNKWPPVLPQRIADRVLGVCVRHGIAVPVQYLNLAASKQTTRQATAHQARAATESVAQGAA
jgi:hypothetical protein